jgi:Protein of unknown function (DUF1579)
MTSTPVSGVPLPLQPGDEMQRLARFHRDVRWTGTIQAGGMGPGSPAMTANGEGRHHTIQNGLWIVGDYRQDQYLTDGSFVLTWELHWVAGWDATSREYVATHADNYGHAGVLGGRLAGDRLVFESPAGLAVRIRLTWDVRTADRLTWRNEISVDGGQWALVEQYDCLVTVS